MNTLFDWLSKACRELNLDIQKDAVITLSNGRIVIADAHVAMLGAPKGMLIFNDYEQIREFSKELVELGYGYTVLEEPTADEKFDLSSYEEMFSDWGWAGTRRTD